MKDDLECSDMPIENATIPCIETMAELENMALRLEASGAYRVSRRLRPISDYDGGPDPALRCAVILDTETTGTVVPGRPYKGSSHRGAGTEAAGPTPSEVISMGLVAIAYEPNTGKILGALDRYHRYRQPAFPIPPEATAIHGIGDALVEGCRIESVEIQHWIRCAVAKLDLAPAGEPACHPPLVIAHSANFDRRMVESHWQEVFAPMPWGCSLTEIPWIQHRYESTKLAFLAMKAGVHHDSHDALADAELLACLLQRDLGGQPAMAHLLDAARRTTHRVFAVGSPYEERHILKARGYRWSAGDDGAPRAWYRDCLGSEVDDELVLLGRGAHPVIRIFGATDRYSIRE